MTIIAGFKSHEGLVVCADTQETVEHSKHLIPKLVFEPRDKDDGCTDDLAAAFCGSSNDGPFADKLITNAWESAQSATSLDGVCEDIEKSIKATYSEFGRIYQRGFCPSAELIYGVKMHGCSKLFNAYGPIVNEKTSYHSSGIGAILANFLASRMYKNHLNLNQCVILAAYVLFQTKEHVEGCGGDSHIAVLRESDGVSGLVSWETIDTFTELLKYADDSTSEMLLELGDFDITDKEFQERAELSLSLLHDLRKRDREKLSDMGSLADMMFGEYRKRDHLGLPKP